MFVSLYTIFIDLFSMLCSSIFYYNMVLINHHIHVLILDCCKVFVYVQPYCIWFDLVFTIFVNFMYQDDLMFHYADHISDTSYIFIQFM